MSRNSALDSNIKEPNPVKYISLTIALGILIFLGIHFLRFYFFSLDSQLDISNLFVAFLSGGITGAILGTLNYKRAKSSYQNKTEKIK